VPSGVGVRADHAVLRPATNRAAVLLIETDSKSLIGPIEGHVQRINGSEPITTGLSGTIGRDHFTGSGAGTEMGKQFEGGTVTLSNSQGSIQLSLGAAFVVKVRKSTSQDVSAVVVAASGKYAS
jgi:hypothetical protein